MERYEIARRSFEALERDDIEAFISLIDEDVTFNSLIAEADRRTFHGHDGVREWWTMLRNALGGVRFEMEDLEEVEGDWTLIKIRTSGTVSGVEVEQTMWQATELRKDRVMRWRVHRTEAEAREEIARAASERPSGGEDTA
jgi:ketosteroid isomerase-like protein